MTSALLGISEFIFFLITSLHIDFCIFVGSCFTFMGSRIITFKFLIPQRIKAQVSCAVLGEPQGMCGWEVF